MFTFLDKGNCTPLKSTCRSFRIDSCIISIFEEINMFNIQPCRATVTWCHIFNIKNILQIYSLTWALPMLCYKVDSSVSANRQILAEHYKTLILVKLWFPPALSCTLLHSPAHKQTTFLLRVLSILVNTQRERKATKIALLYSPHQIIAAMTKAI